MMNINGRNTKEEIKGIFSKLLRNGKDPDRLLHENILLIGLTGAGKSALLCTLNAALTGTYRQWLKQGRGEGQTNTIELIRFERCGVREFDTVGNENENILRELLPTLPTFWDFAGLADENSPSIREILYLVIHGFIPPDTNFKSLEKIQKDNNGDIGALKTVFSKQRSEWKISTVVFVHSSRVNVPAKLIDCLMSVLKEPDPETSTTLYKGDFFLVLTKQDLEHRFLNNDDEDGSLEVLQASSAMGMSNYEMPQQSNPVSPQNVVDDVEKQLAVKLNIQGSLEFSRVKLTNYSDDSGYEYNPTIVQQHLAFLEHMTQPKLRRREPQVIFTSDTTLLLQLRRLFRYIEDRLPSDIPLGMALLIALVAIVVTFVIASIVKSPV